MKKNKKNRTFKFVDETPSSVYYRAIDEDGEVYYASSNPDEIIEECKKVKIARFEKVELFDSTDGWQEWKPKKSKKETDDLDFGQPRYRRRATMNYYRR